MDTEIHYNVWQNQDIFMFLKEIHPSVYQFNKSKQNVIKP